MDYLEGFVTTVGHVAWPVTALGVAVPVRKELLKVIAGITRRIEDKGSDISITRDGLEIKAAVEAQEARLVSMQAEQDQVKSLALRHLKPAPLPKTLQHTADELQNVDDHLRQMADDYMDIDIPDNAERTRAKNAAAEEMAFYVISSKISKDRLANEKHEGLLIALAESIILSAEAGDAGMLLKAARGAERLHVRYRVLVAITKLLERNMMPLTDLADVRGLLHEYEAGADGSLKRLIYNITSLVNEAVHSSKC